MLAAVQWQRLLAVWLACTGATWQVVDAQQYDLDSTSACNVVLYGAASNLQALMTNRRWQYYKSQHTIYQRECTPQLHCVLHLWQCVLALSRHGWLAARLATDHRTARIERQAFAATVPASATEQCNCLTIS